MHILKPTCGLILFESTSFWKKNLLNTQLNELYLKKKEEEKFNLL